MADFAAFGSVLAQLPASVNPYEVVVGLVFAQTHPESSHAWKVQLSIIISLTSIALLCAVAGVVGKCMQGVR